MSIEKTIQRLVEQIHQSTEHGTVMWSELSDADGYQIGVGSGIVSVETDGRSFTLNIHRTDGRLVEKIEASPETQVFSMIRDLHIAATSSVLRERERFIDEMFVASEKGDCHATQREKSGKLTVSSSNIT